MAFTVNKAITKKKKYRHTSAFYRKLNLELQNGCSSNNDIPKSSLKNYFVKTKFIQPINIVNQCGSSTEMLIPQTVQDTEFTHNDLIIINKNVSDKYFDISSAIEHTPIPIDSESDSEEYAINLNISLQQELREWALVHKLTHTSVNRLLTILRNKGMVLPADSRTLLQSPVNIETTRMGNGEFWYNGIKTCLLSSLSKITQDISVSLVFNVDGLPPYKSASIEFWPILCKIESMRHVTPMVIAIYCGHTKPPLQDFFSQFVDELDGLLKNGITNNNGYKINISVKYFVCDTPARSFIKGTVGFNGAHGCIKCTTIGEYDKNGRHMSFPRIDCPLRTDQSFRNKLDDDHHKEDTPLVKLPIDMIEDFIVADSLHLFDLGLMRKCLYGWIYGSYNFRTKLSARDIDLLSDMLEQCNSTKPVEIHRAIRSLKCLKFWKGSEYRTFLLYLGPVVLKDFLTAETYDHFITLHCAVTLISCNFYLKYINIAEQLFKDYIEQFINIYGIDAISSNVHNLCHVINDVKKFGNLSEISSYPFENFLGQIKGMLRNGNRPLAQIAKRVTELSQLNSTTSRASVGPYLKYEKQLEKHQLACCNKVFSTLHIDSNYVISNDCKNKWFMTKSNDIVSMINGTYYQDKIHIYGAPIKFKEDFFDLPVRSSYLNIYKANDELSLPKLYTLEEIKCKLISLKYKNLYVFIPLVHTLDIEVTKDLN